MNKNKLIRFLNNQSSVREREEVSQWLKEPESKEELDSILKSSWEESNSSNDTEGADRMLNNIHQKIKKSSKGHRAKGIFRIWQIAKVAASFVLIGVFAYFLYEQVNQPSSIEAIPEVISVITKKVEVGKKLKLRLPDKTFVILNSNSTLSYRSDFGKEDREIILEGEAYFEIFPDKSRPFRVKSGNVVTTALGTEFNAYSREGDVKIALTEGKVKVEQLNLNSENMEAVLEPGQMAQSSDKNKQQLAVGKFNPKDVISWKQGKIRFKSKRLSEVVKTLETWYGVEFVNSQNINLRRKVSGEFNNENLDNVMEGLTFSLGIRYEINGNKVYLRK